MSVVDAPTRPLSIAEANERLTAPGSRFEIEEIDIRGVPTKVWKHGPSTLTQVFEASTRFADRTFIVLEDDRVSFDGFQRAARVLAQRLAADGVGKGDRVAIVMRNLPEWPVAFFATALLGAIATPLNAWWTGAELTFGLADSAAKVIIADGERMARIEGDLDALPDLVAVYVARSDEPALPPKTTRLEDVIGAPDGWEQLPTLASPAVDIGPEDEATIFYTSGTTGKPKGAPSPARETSPFEHHGRARASMARRAFLRRGLTPIPTPASVGASTLPRCWSVPFFHATGCMAILNGQPGPQRIGKLVDDAQVGRR